MADERLQVLRDDADWPLGTASDVAWITDGTTIDRTIQSSMPLVFEAYATIVLAEDETELERQDRAVIEILSEQGCAQPWWLGYLDTGADDIVLPDAPRVTLYAGWSYVLVQAGPEQALNWRSSRLPRRRRLPDLIFPPDRSWLLSTLWDDDWTCIGGRIALLARIISNPDLKLCARRVNPGEDATPRGHVSI
jgi:hypothetical protein